MDKKKSSKVSHNDEPNYTHRHLDIKPSRLNIVPYGMLSLPSDALDGEKQHGIKTIE